LLPSLLAAACLCLICSWLPTVFLTARPNSPSARGHTAMRGFKEDFEAWRSSLTPEEREMVQTQAAGEFNKKFRKSDEFKKDLPEEKVKSFSKVLGKFFDAEAADYKKEVAAKVPNYNRLLEKAGDKVLDFAMSSRIVEIDRDADRRYTFATRKAKKAAEKGEMFPQSSPMVEVWEFKNDDAESHEALTKLMDAIKGAKDDLSGEDKEAVEALLKIGIPPMGEKLEVFLPQQLVNQLHYAHNYLAKAMDEFKENHTEAEVEAVQKHVQPAMQKVMVELTEKHVAARDEVEEDVKLMKSLFRSQSKDKYKTKADVLRSIWAELPKYLGKPVPPVDEELLADMEQIPAVREGEFRHNWGIADKLYKSEAIDAFGMKYLLGVFDTPAEAEKAFVEWNTEYEKARADMKSEMQQWSKQENARLEADTSGADRIKKILEEARR